MIYIKIHIYRTKLIQNVLHTLCCQTNYLGVGDMHDPKHDDTEVVIPLAHYKYNETMSAQGHCLYSMSLYYSDAFESETGTHVAVFCTVAIAIIFILMAGTFAMYDHFVRRRNSKVVSAAAKSNAIISSLFPTQVRERLFAEKEEQQLGASSGTKSKLKSMLTSGSFMEVKATDEVDENEFMYKSKPIADLFPETTILFADIAGFTAWSSVREPCQVFVLLETLYRAFDEIAKKRRVFKVSELVFVYLEGIA
jgi:Adenylate and Guanylate cyclase catalytic domain